MVPSQLSRRRNPIRRQRFLRFNFLFFFFFPFLFDFSMSFYNLYFLIIIHVLMGADIKAVLKDDTVYNEAAAVAFPLYNKSHMICLQFPNRGGDVNTLSIYTYSIVLIYIHIIFFP